MPRCDSWLGAGCGEVPTETFDLLQHAVYRAIQCVAGAERCLAPGELPQTDCGEFDKASFETGTARRGAQKPSGAATQAKVGHRQISFDPTRRQERVHPQRYAE